MDLLSAGRRGLCTGKLGLWRPLAGAGPVECPTQVVDVAPQQPGLGLRDGKLSLEILPSVAQDVRGVYGEACSDEVSHWNAPRPARAGTPPAEGVRESAVS